MTYIYIYIYVYPHVYVVIHIFIDTYNSWETAAVATATLIYCAVITN